MNKEPVFIWIMQSNKESKGTKNHVLEYILNSFF